MRTLLLVSLAIAAVSSAVAAPCTAGPGVWDESNYGADAGALPATADITSGGGSLDTICGKIGNATDGVDMYEILITGTFSATVSDRNGSTLDPALFLFDSNGNALYGEENGAFSGLSVTPGLYYLAVTSDGQAPTHNGNDIFTLDPGLLTPTFAHTKISGWDSGGGSSGEYRVSLTGADYAQAPEPATIGLMGLGLLGLGFARRRR